MSATIIKREESIGGYYCEYVGLSTDTKPTRKGQNGSKFTEMDTGKTYLYNEANKTWITQGLSKYLTKIEITTAPTKVEYEEGEEFDATGMVVKATYTDASYGNVTAESPVEPLVAGQTSVTISYTEDGVVRTTTQAITVTVPDTDEEAGEQT